jgi:hypothetical protein
MSEVIGIGAAPRRKEEGSGIDWGGKRAMREIVRVFQREIVSNDDELKSVAEHGRSQGPMRSKPRSSRPQTLIRFACQAQSQLAFSPRGHRLRYKL